MLSKEILIVLTALPLTFCGTKTKRETIVVQGEPGPQGEVGEAGEKGDKGDRGDKGEVGLTGQTGAQGATGPSGSDGRDGDRGEMGPQGPSGRDGNNGRDGMNGRDGANGNHGNDGRDGEDGDYIIWPKPKYSKYCYTYQEVYLFDKCNTQIANKYHVYYQVHTMPNGDVFAQLCEGYKATGRSCSQGLRTNQTFVVGDQNYSTAPLQSRYIQVKLTKDLEAEVKGKDFVISFPCTNTAW